MNYAPRSFRRNAAGSGTSQSVRVFPSIHAFLILTALSSTGFCDESRNTAAQRPPLSLEGPAEAHSLEEIFSKGQFRGQARYRYEVYQQDSQAAAPIQHTATASTLRLSLGFQTASFAGFSAFLEGSSVLRLGVEDHYRMPTVPKQNNRGYPIIVDPDTTQLNQFWLQWKAPAFPLELRIGREELQLLNGRFLGNSLWRQNHHTLDLASVKTGTPFAGGYLSGYYAYLAQVNRVIGDEATDSPLRMNSHLFNLEWTKKGFVTASAYGLFLDYDRADQAFQSTQTNGLRLAGPWMLSKKLGIHYVTDWAHQTDYATNPNHLSANYWCLELGPQYRNHKLFAGWSALEGKSATNKIMSPLAPPFNGWVEKFLTTPTLGLDARYLTATGPVPYIEGLSYTITAYDYYAAANHVHYGQELDAQLEYKFARYYNLTWRFGNYWADNLLTDSLRTSITIGFTF